MARRPLNSWVMENCKPGTVWKWRSSGRGSDVVLQLDGYTTYGRSDGPYSVEVEHLSVVRGGRRRRHMPNDPRTPRLPKWFTDDLRSHADAPPNLIKSGAFRRLVERGTVKRLKR